MSFSNHENFQINGHGAVSSVWLLISHRPEGATFPVWCPIWHDFGVKSLGWFDEIGTRLTMARTPNLGCIESGPPSIHPSMCKVNTPTSDLIGKPTYDTNVRYQHTIPDNQYSVYKISINL